MNSIFFIARRYLFSKKSHNAINIVTTISVVCVTVVTAALIIIMSAMNGLSNLVESLYNSFHADIRITPAAGKTFISDSSQVAQIKKIPGVAYYTEILDENGLTENADRQMIVTLRGVGDDYAKNNGFDTVVRDGNFELKPHGRTGAVVGMEIGAKLQLNALSPLHIYVPKRDRNLAVDLNNLDEEPFNKDLALVTGIYAVSSDFDGKYVIMPIEKVRELMAYTKESSSAEIGLAANIKADDVIASISAILGPSFKVEGRYEQNKLLYQTLKSEKLWTFFILLFILTIATFNTIGSLTLLIIEKKKDIGILWSMGASRKFIQRIFFTEGIYISLFGLLIGTILGIAICYAQDQFGLIRFSEGFVVDAYPVQVKLTDILLISGAVMLIGILAALYPVRVYTRKYQQVKL
jgi:ABC-type lipoprotein release transport system permease subunit